MQFVVSGSILFLPPYTQGEKKNICSELESNPDPLASKATAITSKPWLLGQEPKRYKTNDGCDRKCFWIQEEMRTSLIGWNQKEMILKKGNSKVDFESLRLFEKVRWPGCLSVDHPILQKFANFCFFHSNECQPDFSIFHQPKL